MIGVAIPNNALVSWLFVDSLLAVAREHIVYTAEGTSIADNKNQIFERARKKNEDLLIIDSDMVFQPNQVHTLFEHLQTKDIVTGTAVIGQPPYAPAIFKRTEKDYKSIEPQEGVNRIDACGAFFLGISKESIKKMPENPFKQIEEGDLLHGIDISFCMRASAKGLSIWCDSTLSIGHLRMREYYVS